MAPLLDSLLSPKGDEENVETSDITHPLCSGGHIDDEEDNKNVPILSLEDQQFLQGHMPPGGTCGPAAALATGGKEALAASEANTIVTL